MAFSIFALDNTQIVICQIYHGTHRSVFISGSTNVDHKVVPLAKKASAQDASKRGMQTIVKGTARSPKGDENALLVLRPSAVTTRIQKSRH